MKPLRAFLFATLGCLLFLSLNLLLPLTAPAQSPEEVRFEKLAEADALYITGDKAGAEKLYREAKEPFPKEGKGKLPEPFSDPQLLSPAGQVHWREAQRGSNQKLESLLFSSLDNLTKEQPAFIPGHMFRVQALRDYDRNDQALAALENAVSQFPDSVELTKMQVKALEEDKQWLEASIAARQFAMVYPDHPQTAEFKRIADEDFKRFKKKLKGGTISTGILGAIGGILTGDEGATASQLAPMLLLGESDFGAKLAEAYKQELPLLEEPTLTEYINKVGQDIAKLMGRDNFKYEFYVVQDDSLNAFALPGGKVFVHTGALLNCNSEAELAGLLGHEIAHAVLSHGYKKMTKAGLLANLGRAVPLGEVISTLTTLEYSRSSERQSDLLGTRVLATAGYAADGLYSFMVTMKEKSGESPPEYLATHPLPENRVSYLQELIQRNGYNRYAYEGVKDYAQIKDKLKQLLALEEQRHKAT